MTYQPFLIANQRTGQETDLEPWILPDDGYPNLWNAYQYRGVIRRKGGYTLFGRIGVYTPTLVASRGAGNTIVNVTLVGAPLEPGSIIVTDGTTTFTDNGIGGFTITGGTGTVNAPTNYVTGAINITFTTANPGATITARYYRAVGANSPCMGLLTQENLAINSPKLIAFDLTNAYQYSNAINNFINISNYKVDAVDGQTTNNTVAWTGNNSQFFYSENFQGAFFATNNVPGSNFFAISAVATGATTQITTATANNFAVGDVVYFDNITQTAGTTPSRLNRHTGLVTISGNPFTVNINTAGDTYTANTGIAWAPTLTRTGSGDGIRWYDNTGWVNFEPPLDSTPSPQILQGCLLLFAYKNYLVALSTWEGPAGTAPTNFQQRARWSQNGPVFYGSPLPTGSIVSAPVFNAWYNAPGLGGFFDAPTAEVIVSAEFIKDTLVVYFERSTYRLSWTGNSTAPFKWEKINTEIGSEATGSVVPFDKSILNIASNGVYECDSINIERVDQKIPDTVFNFGQSNSGISRIQGIRDYYNQFVYWLYVNQGEGNDADPTTVPTFPNEALVYNYLDGSWAIFQAYFTCFGHYQVTGNLTWGNCTQTWANMPVPWNSGANQTQFPIVVAGNQQGYVERINFVSSNNNFPQWNDISLKIQNITNAAPSVFTVPNHNLGNEDYVQITNTGIMGLDGNIYSVVALTANTFSLLDSNNAPVNNISGFVANGNIQNVDNFEIQTKNFTPFVAQGEKLRVGYVDLYLQTNVEQDSAMTVFLRENDVDSRSNDYTVSKTVALTGPLPNPSSKKFWKRVYLNQTCQSYNLMFTMTTFENTGSLPNTQIFDPQNTQTQLAIYGMNLWMAPAGRFVR